jgi:hypothetical protein
MNTLSPLPKLVFHDSLPLDTANHVFDMHTYATNASVFFFFCIRKLSTTRLFLRLQHGNAFRSESLKARVLSHRTALGKLIRFTINDVFVMTFALPGYTQTSNATETIRDQNMLDGVLLLLSAIIQLLLIWVVWPIYWSFCSIVEKKGVALVDATPSSESSSISRGMTLSV